MKIQQLVWSGACLVLVGCLSNSDPAIRTDMIHIPATASTATVQSNEWPQATFQDTLIDLGRMVEGELRDVQFHFINTGSKPLVIADVSSSCGCTVARDWPKEAIQSGGTGNISVRFDSRGRAGENTKIVYVVTNAVPSTYALTLKSRVVGPGSS